jgi:uncharacterized protein YcbX
MSGEPAGEPTLMIARQPRQGKVPAGRWARSAGLYHRRGRTGEVRGIVALVATGRVAAVWRWPVKSMGGERVPAARLDAGRGVAGDRAHLLVEADGRALTARQAPRMLRWTAAYPSAPGEALDPAHLPRPVLTGPDGTSWTWDDPALPDVLAKDLAPDPAGPRRRPAPSGDGLRRVVALERDPQGRPDLPGTVLVTTAASLAALVHELGRPLDPRRFRPNLHLELDAPPFAELGWQGAVLELRGEGGRAVDVELLGPCTRCAIPTRDPDTAERWPELLRHLIARHGQQFGVNAKVIGQGVGAAEAEARVVAP